MKEHRLYKGAKSKNTAVNQLHKMPFHCAASAPGGPLAAGGGQEATAAGKAGVPGGAGWGHSIQGMPRACQELPTGAQHHGELLPSPFVAGTLRFT